MWGGVVGACDREPRGVRRTRRPAALGPLLPPRTLSPLPRAARECGRTPRWALCAWQGFGLTGPVLPWGT